MQFLVNANFDLIGKRKVAIIISISLMLLSIISVFFHKGPNYGIDFLGGTSIELQFAESISIADVRTAVTNAGFPNAEIKNFGADNEILIRVQEQEEGTEITTAIKDAISQAFASNPYEVRFVEKVGPKIGAELREAAVWAILAAMFFILLYISWRFEFVFAVGAIAALFHDVIITLGVFSILELEITLAIIAAFLTIVGYSLNDTIVVFDRIRENLKVLRRDSYPIIINKSLNQSLSRTVVTSLTTLMVVLILYFFGGEVIRNFAFALIIGVMIGTYSSIFVASPILLEWHERSDAKNKAKPAAKRA
jgi:preprotein translocase subunit SecF